MIWFWIGMLLITGVFVWRILVHIWRWPAIDLLRYDDDYINASAEQKRQMENDMLDHFASCHYINGELVAPGQEIEALGSRLDYFSMCEDEEEWQLNMKQIPAFIGPAKALLSELRNTQPEDEEHDEDLRSQIEDGEGYISEAERIVANPEAAFTKWRED